MSPLLPELRHNGGLSGTSHLRQMLKSTGGDTPQAPPLYVVGFNGPGGFVGSRRKYLSVR